MPPPMPAITPPMVIADTFTAVMLMPRSVRRPRPRRPHAARRRRANGRATTSAAITSATTIQMKMHDVERGPAILRKIADLAEALAAMRAELQVAGLDLIGEVEEEQPHGLAESGGRDDQHQPLHAQRREIRRRRRPAPATIADASKRRHERPAREHGQHARDVGADGEEAGLRQAHLAGQQHAIGRQPEQRMHADDLRRGRDRNPSRAAPSVAPGRRWRTGRPAGTRGTRTAAA